MSFGTRASIIQQSASVFGSALNAKSVQECDDTIDVLVEFVRSDEATGPEAKKQVLEALSMIEVLKANADPLRKLRKALEAKGVKVDEASVLNVRNAFYHFLSLNGGDSLPYEDFVRPSQSQATVSGVSTYSSGQSHDTLKAKVEFSKYYYDSSKRYNGSQSGILFSDWRRDLVANFRHYNIAEGDMKDLVERTVDGKVKDYIGLVLQDRSQDMSWEELVERIKLKFVSTDVQVYNLRVFNSISFTEFKSRFPTMRNEEVFENMLDEMRRLQKNLASMYQGDQVLRDNVLKAMEHTKYSPFYSAHINANNEDLFGRIKMVMQSVDASEMSSASRSSPEIFFQQKLTEPKPSEALFQRMIRQYRKSQKFPKKYFGGGYPKVYSRKKNKLGPDGNPIRCDICDSTMHLRATCPHSEENVRRAFWLSFLLDMDQHAENGEDSEHDSDYAEALEDAEDKEQEEHVSNWTCVVLNTSADMHRLKNLVGDELGDPLIIDKTAPKDRFWGICFDNGSTISVTSLSQFLAYCSLCGMEPKYKASKNMIRWGVKFPSIGRATVRCTLDHDHFFKFEVEILDTGDIFFPMICGLDVQKKFQIAIFHHPRQSFFTFSGRRYNLCEQNGHLFWLYEPTFHECYAMTMDELTQVHRKFGHATAEKIINVFNRAGKDLSQDERESMGRIVKNCDICKWYTGKPSSYKVSAEIEVSFNHTIQADVFYIDGTKPIIHIICKGTKFQVASFIEDKSAKTLWKYLYLSWIQIFDAPHRLQIDQDSAMTSNDFRGACETNGIILDVVPVEAHHSVGLVERYHGVLRIVFLKLRDEATKSGEEGTVDERLLLAYAVRAANNSVGMGGYIPSLLVFGTFPKFVISPDAITEPTQKRRITLMMLARREFERLISEKKLRDVRTAQVPEYPKETQGSMIGNSVLVRREEGYKWTGPYLCTAVEGNKVSVLIPPSGRKTEFHINNVKKYILPEQQPTNLLTLCPMLEAADYKNPYVFLSRESLPGNQQENFEAAKEKEFQDLVEKGTFEYVESLDARGKNVLGGRFVLTIKEDGKCKARFVAQGHRDKDKHESVTEAPTLSRTGMRMLCHLSAVHEWPLYYRDYNQAYLQSTSDLQRDIFLKVRDEDKEIVKKAMNINSDQGDIILKIIRPLYGLVESGTFWYMTISEAFKKEGLDEAAIDPCILYLPAHHFQGAIGLLVDDELFFGDESFLAMEKQVSDAFAHKGTKPIPFTFDGIEFAVENESLKLCQTKYIRDAVQSLAGMHMREESFKELSSLRGRLSWLAFCTRPDIAVITAKLSQVTMDTFKTEDIKKAAKVLEHLKETETTGLLFQKIDWNTAKLCVYSDAAYATNADNSSQLGFAIFIADETKRANLIHWQSVKSRLVVHSVLGAELLAMCLAFDIAEAIQIEVFRMCKIRLPINVFTDSKSIFDTIAHKSILSEKRLMIKMQIMRQAYENGTILDVAHIPGECNIADELTKQPKSQSKLLSFLRTGIVDHPVNCWLMTTVAKKKRSECQ